ncbi:hypothetical protein ACJIZ3_004516 [Penstemon smallii]|uniref:Homologous recombination OB-fold protein OB-fold domain-containing protein n=1 Tax=Penstemon smallii TaxID=265156 RepID=A0ABD3S2A5_9LAMI
MEHQQQPWEALDLDDSDLPSLLRPCKRHRSTTIPGPAGAIQSAMLRKTLDRQNDTNNVLIPTQEYIRRAVEDTSEFDDDFTRHPWLSALQFLGVGGVVIPSTPISSIKKCADAGRVERVVAVIKSCTPNGLGGLIVMLKDPTGTIGASVHHKVLCESEFRKNLTVGAVLILQKVTVFAPVRSAQYLNITLKNLVEVFCQGSGPSFQHDNSAYPAQHAHPANDSRGKAKTLEKMSTMQNIEMDVTTNEGGQNMGLAENRQCHNSTQKQNHVDRSSQSNSRASSNVIAAVRRKHSELTQDASKEVPEDIIETRLNGSDKCTEGGVLEGALSSNNVTGANSVAKSINEEIRGTNEDRVILQPLLVKPSLPQWTDEQLDELFAGDEDDGSLL